MKTAASTDGGGPIEETLKWGDPAYVTSATKSGNTIRVVWKKARPTRYAMKLKFVGDRRIVFGENDVLPKALSPCVAAALTYHRDRRAARHASR